MALNEHVCYFDDLSSILLCKPFLGVLKQLNNAEYQLFRDEYENLVVQDPDCYSDFNSRLIERINSLLPEGEKLAISHLGALTWMIFRQ